MPHGLAGGHPRVLPIETGIHAGMDGPVHNLQLPRPAERDVAHDAAAHALYLEGPEDVAWYR